MKTYVITCLSVLFLISCGKDQMIDPHSRNAEYSKARARSGADFTITLDAKVLLGGALSKGDALMSEAIGRYLPMKQPFGDSPYNYQGNERMEGLPMEYVDWVYLELRDPVSDTIVAQRAALVTVDGAIVDVNGNKLIFNLPARTYNILVAHRNHLDIITSEPVSFGRGYGVIDFSQNPPFEGHGMMRLQQGYAMMPGDCNWDQRISYMGGGNDKAAILLKLGGAENFVIGYHPEDINMNGAVSYVGRLNDKSFLLNTGLRGDAGKIVLGQLSE